MKSFMNELSITYYGNLRSYVEMLENVFLSYFYFFHKYVDYEIHSIFYVCRSDDMYLYDC